MWSDSVSSFGLVILHLSLAQILTEIFQEVFGEDTMDKAEECGKGTVAGDDN